jgi:AcrR family transcriptional regulator
VAAQTNSKTAANDGARRRVRLPRAEREEQLLDIAKGLFAAQGFQATSIEDIARAAGVTRPVVYDHFGSKDNIYLACVRAARAELERMLTEAVSARDDPGAQLWGGINAYFEFIERDASAWDVLFGPGAAVTGPTADEVRHLRFATVSRIGELLAPAVSNVDALAIDALAHALSGSGEQLAKWWREHPELSREQVAGYHMAFSWLGLRELVRQARDRDAVAGEPLE